LIWFDLIWFDLIWFDLIWFDLIWFDLIWFDLSRFFDLILIFIGRAIQAGPNTRFALVGSKLN
jgi:hypothetical protein